MTPNVQSFFDDDTNTISYVVSDPATGACAIIDPVLNYDAAAARTATISADRVIDHVRREGLNCEWVLETHVHADHLSAAPYVQGKLGGKLAIGDHITITQSVFGEIFNAGPDLPRDGSQFDQLFHDGDSFPLGKMTAHALHTPGHTPACMTYCAARPAKHLRFRVRRGCSCAMIICPKAAQSIAGKRPWPSRKPPISISMMA